MLASPHGRDELPQAHDWWQGHDLSRDQLCDGELVGKHPLPFIHATFRLQATVHHFERIWHGWHTAVKLSSQGVVSQKYSTSKASEAGQLSV